nr:immunoglobulin heavy chain junction region [Macaca mulatta]MOV56008.1 immunoglobulin heavy chain junction region [Macaca mulatta]MOV56289.1 immunoglobulin heavy chain junction region [Macaca mulatta]MOV60892.1 immunoglobulin heavy chain junction region [Macaca mulatta]
CASLIAATTATGRIFDSW